MALEEIDKFRLGYVHDPLPEHEAYKGMLVIPYLRRHPRHGWSCVSLRYRRIGDDGPKYMTMPGDRPRLFNTIALTQTVTEVGIAEGEIDAITASVCGMPTVGVPGAQTWGPYWNELFKGYKTVFIFTDGDDPGIKMGRKLAKNMPNAKIIHCPDGEDLNSIYTSQGIDAVKERWQ